jgi:histidine decarboxylase
MRGDEAARRGKDVSFVLRNARSSQDAYCEGFGNNPSLGCYVTTPIIAAGKARLKGLHDRSLVLEQIQAFDTAEAEGAYIGQINLFQVSSFCGPTGVVWGHDVAQCRRRSFNHEGAQDVTKGASVYSADCLLEASARLFGTARKRRFPILPGSVVPCAYKTVSEIGPVTLYGGLAVGIPREQSASASLFMEYVGSERGLPDEEHVEREKTRMVEKLLESVVDVGVNHDIDFDTVYVGARALAVEPDQMGCVLVAIPYVILARNAMTERLIEKSAEISIDDWEAEVSRHFFHNA